MSRLLREKLRKQNFMLLRIDPCIPLTIRDEEGNILNISEGGNEILDNLENAGFDFFGKNLNFETEKPRWEAIVTLQSDVRQLFAKIDKRARNKIRRCQKTV